MTGPDMRIAADRFYDGTHLYDIRLLSTMGYSDSQIPEVAAVEGVKAVMPAKSTDVMGDINGEQYALRISSIPIDALDKSSCEDGCNVYSDDDSYLNRLILEEGRWPNAKGECVISADRVAGVPFEMGDTLEVLYGSQDLDGVLDVEEFTIVGTAHSSSFVSAVTMGATSLGSGSIQQFAFVSENNFSNDYPYTELFISVEGAADLFSGSDEYKEHVGQVRNRFESMADSLAESRLASLKQEAQDELDDAKEEYETEKADALQKLDDAKKELDDAAAEIDDGVAKIEDGQAQINSGYSQLYDGQSELNTQKERVYNELSAARATLEEKERELNDAQAQLDANRSQVDSWPDTRAGLVEQLNQTQAGLEEAQQGMADIDAGIAQTEAALAQVPEDDPKRAQLEAELAGLQQRKMAVQAQIGDATQGIAQLEAVIATGDESLAQFQASQAQVDEGRAQLQAGWDEYNRQAAAAYTQIANAENELSSNQQKLIDSQAEINESQADIDKGREELASGREEYDEEYAKAMKEIDDAEQELADAQQEIDDIELPEIYVLDRTKNYGVESQVADSERIDNIARVFPFIFFLVAALVALTTMTRMVDEERNVIGTYKALGYSKARITGRYLIYAGIASVVGAVIGLALLSQILPFTISKAYAIIYNIPDYPLPMPFDWKLGLLSGGLGVGITLLATLAAAMATLRETPAALMLPRAPKAGKRILLERIGPLWKHVSFSWKVTFRNLFRYKKRLLMTVIGIAGCTALLLTGWGLHDSIWDIIDKQYGPVVNYNVITKLDDEASEEEITAAEAYMASHADTEDLTRVHSANMQVSSVGHNELGVELVVPSNTDEFAKLLTIKNRLTQKLLDFDDSSVVLTEKLATTLDLKVGDSFTLYEQDEIGNALGKGYELTLTGIMENYIGNWAYIGKDAFTSSTNLPLNFATLYGRCTEDLDERAVLTDTLHDMEGVRTVTYNDETIDSYRKMLSSVDMIVVVLVVSAAALAFIVLYNLTNINITERRREIASLKVLGFTKREVYAYIFREITLLTLIGAAFGLVLGVFLESFVCVTAEVDYVMFGRDIHTTSFVISFVMTLLFTAFVMLFMRHKLNSIDMVESLKSVE
ncbi:MAG: FtsX-like permease family protein [Eggerthellaceae bacterium]|nr:FtsX-like permease family protein [Eggerthellaceae bacterium]